MIVHISKNTCVGFSVSGFVLVEWVRYRFRLSRLFAICGLSSMFYSLGGLRLFVDKISWRFVSVVALYLGVQQSFLPRLFQKWNIIYEWFLFSGLWNSCYLVLRCFLVVLGESGFMLVWLRTFPSSRFYRFYILLMSLFSFECY